MTQKELAAPVVGPESRPFWDAANNKTFLLKSCQSCGQNFWYPRSNCPFCWSSATHWTQASGQGSLYSFSVMRRAKVPYALAYVQLREGPVVMTNLVNVDLDTIRIGMGVSLCFQPAVDGSLVPVFEPLARSPN